MVANSNYTYLKELGKYLKNRKGNYLMYPSDIWNFRARHNLTIPALAELIGVHKSQISRWETGQRNPPLWLEKFLACIDHIKALEKALP